MKSGELNQGQPRSHTTTRIARGRANYLNLCHVSPIHPSSLTSPPPSPLALSRMVPVINTSFETF